MWRMRIACWITKATNTHSEYVTLTAFPLQQWLRERASMLLYSTLPVLFRSLSLHTLILTLFFSQTFQSWIFNATTTES
jgi:hypothetical protein